MSPQVTDLSMLFNDKAEVHPMVFLQGSLRSLIIEALARIPGGLMAVPISSVKQAHVHLLANTTSRTCLLDKLVRSLLQSCTPGIWNRHEVRIRIVFLDMPKVYLEASAQVRLWTFYKILALHP